MSRKLHIGGKSKAEGWEVLNINPAPYVDHVCNANNLSQFIDDTFDEIYASHVLEHFDYKDEMINTLIEWKRVLLPGGKIYISVPDLEVHARLLLERDKLSVDERFFIMRMLFGCHVDQYDYHYVGLNWEFLAYFLRKAGYVNLRRVGTFNLFDDLSAMTFRGVLVSLNVIAEKPATS